MRRACPKPGGETSGPGPTVSTTMARSTTVYVCSACAAETPRWMGQCPGCGEWNTLTEETRGASKKSVAQAGRGAVKPLRLADVKAQHYERLRTGIGELD